MGLRAPENPNVCAKCGASDVSEIPLRQENTSPGSAPSTAASRAQPPSELERFLEIEGPSVVECFAALEQAKQALAETALQEQKPSASPVNHR
jgi:hypothetical protein